MIPAMIASLRHFLGWLVSAFRSREDLVLENKYIPVKEHFGIRGEDIDEPTQDLLFEICRINRIWAYRIRPFDLRSGLGGHGDDTLEIACSQEIPNVSTDAPVEIILLRDDIAAA